MEMELGTRIDLTLVTALIILGLVIILFIVLDTKIRGIRRDIGKTNYTVEGLGKKIEKIAQENQNNNLVNKQIKDKSETISKILDQTNKVYKEILDKKPQEELSDFDIEKLTEGIKSEVEEAEENVSRTVDEKNIEDRLSKSVGLGLTKIVKEIDMEMQEEEKKLNEMVDELDLVEGNVSKEKINHLLKTLNEYEKVLQEEKDFFINEIERINKERNLYPAEERLAKKEEIYNGLKNTDSKMKDQQKMKERVLIIRERERESLERKEEEDKLDELLNQYTN